MKKLIFINVALVALAMFVSCQKEQFTKIVTDTKGVTEFTASIELPTKTVIDATGKVTWAAGDEITVTDANSTSAVYVAKSAGTSTKFILKEGETPVTEAPYTATYGDITKQVYDAAGANCPLKAPQTNTTNFTFSSPYAVVKLTAKSEAGEVIKSVGVTYGENNSTLDCGDGVTLTSEGTVFYIAVQPSAEAAALSVTFYTDEKKATKERASEVTLAAKDLLPVTFNSFTWVNKVETFKAVYDTNGDANTLTFYYDGVDHSGEGIIVYEDGTDKFLFDDTKTDGAKWGYNDKRGEIKSVVIDASVADYNGLTSTAYMFQGMTAASDISGAEHLDMSNVTDMSFMFNNFGGGTSGSPTTLNVVPDVSEWNTGNVTNMTGMFESYGNFSSSLDKVPDVSGWNTGNVTDMADMFNEYGRKSTVLNTVPDVSGWNTSNVTTMTNMFQNYGYSSTALSTVPNVSGWNTSNVTKISNLFNGYGHTSNNIDCTLDLSGWDLSKITGNNGENVFNFNPKTFDVTIPAKTGEKSNEGGKWYYGDGTNHIAPPEGKTFTILPAGALKGVFTVSDPDGTPNSGDEKKVHFSQGNLWADGDKALHFEANQYSSASSWDASHVSHFTWSSTVAVAVGDIFRGDYLFCDESHKVSVDGGEAIYYALSKDEWTYLFNTRTMTNGKDRYSNAMSGVSIGGATYKGVFLYPDNYNGEVVSSSMSWNDINAAGIVFLPAAGYRFQSSLDFVGDSDYYWSSTAYDENEAYYVYFGSGDLPDHDDRDYGFSVRLVTEVPAAGSTIEDFNKKNDDPGNWN